MKLRNISRRQFLTAMIAVLALAAALYVWLPSLRSDDGRQLTRLAVGREAPVFEATNTKGERINLADYRGRTVLLNFWASWCKPCVKEMPLIDEAYRTQETEFQLVSVNVGDAKGTVNEFIEDTGITFPVIIDAVGRVSDMYQVVGLPATFVIDTEGKLSYASSGEITERKQLQSMLRSGQNG